MRDFTSIYEELNQIFGLEDSNMCVIEKQINSELQSEYLEYSKNIQVDTVEKEVISRKELIFDHNYPYEAKKTLFIQLASLNNIEALRTLERYINSTNTCLKDWAYLAFQESKLLIESSILNEFKILITTGLGGKGLALRYFIVFFTPNGDYLLPIQKEILKKEITYQLGKVGGEIEELEIESNFATLLTVLPLKVALDKLFHNIIKECNELGNFLFDDYIITNVRKLSGDEIVEILAVNNIF